MRAERASKPRDRWVDRALLAGIALRTLWGLAMLPVIPLLIASDPLLLTLLSGSTVAEVVVGARVRVGEVAWPVAVLAGVPLWVATNWLYWAAGRRWGDRALVVLTQRMRGDSAARIEAAHRTMARLGPFGVLVARALPVPHQLTYAAAGIGGMRLPVFLALDLLGTALYTAVIVTLGFALGEAAIGVVEAFQRYALAVAVVVAVVLLVVHLVRRRRARSVPEPGA